MIDYLMYSIEVTCNIYVD